MPPVRPNLDLSQIHDISPKLNAKTAVFPGDVPFLRKISQSGEKNGRGFSLSSFQSTLHIGAHADAPSHFDSQGQSIDTLSLHFFLGLCQVIRLNQKIKGKISLKDIKEKTIKAPRILFATESFPSSSSWTNHFNSLSVELIQHMAQHKVITLGIDTPSIDPALSQRLDAHHEMHKHKMMILEGLVLSHIAEGLYHLIALPLKIEGGEASPLRAVLLPLDSSFFSSSSSSSSL